ncbi:hypothetical protein O181_073718 [Austropuccinia psidii MF-1]|uniref:Retrovirus-related Pol polyprotein from transposon TNT 1-94-like beta-barrel domain-containing protein n=1 Tax=Austropuccinia psidii MF-1 TaxID=1389203 RepID=A0A9Q3F5L1_9BASI|nr:hypothetical protein [Austropuccinia psidii MF-1]
MGPNCKKSKQTILDSGANNHMFTSKSDFTDLRISSGGVQIGQEGVKILIKGRGKVLKISNNNKIVFNNALYVPDLPYKLISLSKIWKGKGNLERLQNNKFQVIQNEKKIFNGNIENGLLHITFDNNNAFLSKHERLGHGGKSYNCEACKMGNSTRILFNGKIERPNQPLDEVSVDLMGPITPTSLGGAKFNKDDIPFKNKKDNKNNINQENTIEEEIEPIRREEIELGQPNNNVQQENREPLQIRLRIPRPQGPENTQNSEGTSNIQKKNKKPHWEWELYTKAPKDINSDILQENIIERQSRNNQALVANVGEIASREKDEAFSKNDYTALKAMNANTELDEGNPESLKEAQRRPDWVKGKKAYFTELNCISDQNVF